MEVMFIVAQLDPPHTGGEIYATRVREFLKTRIKVSAIIIRDIPSILRSNRLLRNLWFFHFIFLQGAAAYHREKFIQLGGFNYLFWPLYGEDDDLSYTAWMMDYRILFEPKSSVFHKGGVSTRRFFKNEARKRRAMERARMILVLKNVADRQLLFGFWFFSFLRVLKSLLILDFARLGAFFDIFSRLPQIIRERAQIQAKRKLSDRQIVSLLE